MPTPKRIGRIHAVIPDVQVRPGVDCSHLSWIGNYLAEKRPDVIVCLGDFADMVSLNSYQVGKASAEGTRYMQDVTCAKSAMQRLMRPIRKNGKYRPELHMTLGNHEDRIDREAQSNPRLIGTIATSDLGYREQGWRVHKFLHVANLDGVAYSHYFTSGVMGRPVSSAAALLRERQGSAVMGHVQRVDLAVHPKTQKMAIFAGICYLHDEAYLGPQGNDTRRQILMLHEVKDGRFDPMFVSLEFLKRRYS